ncbi:hypothetical protein LOZ39_000434 [Ophidiomyces ophidiicola]|uniref:Uncharacterized protein n=1 Tax=Ophidiomyces ophidiicola TaxID=1387563 RepID=A0ACB8UVQ2_9EURO|nr:hypothetical protein LOZ61_000505 [Ophidiomyces ophidiicola]KAI1924331.1 hypothetical protein LOZ64_000656 [Ophidiomyces ophidiicola]KAI1929232.1 hypothetical protein LOZ60_001701 [Ophidiomyces ophidiicola]KAI1957709.1 hypothetical protein LOZ59_003811 [Ophidiomyces ophidiicola]KAI1974898.1 hypothetical protein LOZ56_000926 [Ophidiomyces ophidiicola]
MDVHQNSSGTHGHLASVLSGTVADIYSQTGRIGPDLQILKEGAETLVSGGIIDDRKYTIEHIVQLAASLPNESNLRYKLTDQFVTTLWDTLEHPPISYLGDEFKYRTADGSNNNVMYPHLGAAGSHYARTVTPQRPKKSTLPDPSFIFDTLMKREGPTKDHPSKISSMLFHFATIIIHDIFRTDDQNITRLKNSSYLDLGPLYGHNEEQQKGVRAFRDGLLKKDVFAEERVLGQPPGVCALLVAFNRFHNYVVGELSTINERGRFSLPYGITPSSPDYEKACLKRDNDLFQTGRLVTCGLYINVILNDYLRSILNLNDNPVDSDWRLDPRQAISIFDAAGVPRGIGNQVSAEFNMIYRWHPAISNNDETWAKGFFSDVFGAVDPNTLTISEFRSGIGNWMKKFPSDPSKWEFGELKRQPDGGFKDADLVGLLQKSTEAVAGAFGARNVPPVLKAVEILGIEQGRQWGLATLNEFRSFFKLKPHETFLEVNSDPEIAEALEAIYGHPDDIELYTGIHTEEAKTPFKPGSGLCPGFTISTAILFDAVALVRGDRFYTVDYSPENLTSFGFNTANSSFEAAKGGVMYKLLMRAFPGWYRPNSVYAQFPFTTPGRNQEVFAKYGRAGQYIYDKPSFIGPPIPILTWQGVVDVLNDQAQFKVPWGPHTLQLTQHDYMLSGDLKANSQQREFVKKCLFEPRNYLEEVQKFYEAVTSSFLREYSKKAGNSYQVDVVQDIGNLVHANFAGHFFQIPLKSAGGGSDAYTEQQLYDALARLFAYVFLDVDQAKSFERGVVASRDSKLLGERVSEAVKAVQGGRFLILRQAFERAKNKAFSEYGARLVERLSETGKSADEVAWILVPTAAAAVATQAQGWAQLIDLYMSDQYHAYWPSIQKAAQSDSPEDFNKLRKFALEGLRLATPAFGVLRSAASSGIIQDGTRNLPFKERDTIFLNFVSAGTDPTKFPEPEKIRLDRPEENYIHHGWGPHACLGKPFVTTAAASMLKVFGRLKNLRRAPGPAGEMQNKEEGGVFKVFLSPDGSDWGSFPCTKRLLFDDFRGA